MGDKIVTKVGLKNPTVEDTKTTIMKYFRVNSLIQKAISNVVCFFKKTNLKGY